ncbi:MAG: hypothetical protein JMN27_17375 [gamma proteobacterium endosymbiont of Lamellibrachia anaximandri]|nr:hypothetical protein [gamma proteobacterium endosymbiont of Lamellibrachia anaximandri]MBL3535578.1 hypothetical protein [gamma proteobacterium endosymbiont of Lamellibrachia anaximandri]
MKGENMSGSQIKTAAVAFFVLGLFTFFGTVLAEVKTPDAGQAVVPPQIGEMDDGLMKEKPRVEDLGGGKYRIGNIQLDKKAGRFSLPGAMLYYEEGGPIEYMAVMKGGFKSYESVLEMDANAFEFNLACILIGLDAKGVRLPEYHFDTKPVEGDAVDIRVSWEEKGKRVEVDLLDLVKLRGEAPKDDKKQVWSYTGSTFIEGDRYFAQMNGTLIGVVHDPASIIEHRLGLGLEQWGFVFIDAERAPPIGTKLELTVQRINH